MGRNILVVDDEPNICAMLTLCLTDGNRVVTATSVEEARARLREEAFDLAFVDLRLGDGDGIDVLKAAGTETAVVIMTAFGTIENAVDAIRRGAAEYLQKPFTAPQVHHLVARVMQDRGVRRELADLRAELRRSPLQVTAGAAMKPLWGLAQKAAASDATVLLRGESGTGKGVLARFLHENSARKDGPFVTVDLTSLSAALIESELFGHARGAFTGAVTSSAGRIETARGGTLFLDEVGDLPLPLQPKLLRLVQDQQFERVGEAVTRNAEVRILAATHRDLKQMVASGSFREDLYYRLKVIELALPPLRARPEDILPLAEYFLRRSSQRAQRPVRGFSEAAQGILARYSWPGNVRELENSIERAVILADGEVADADLFAAEVESLARSQPASDPEGESLAAAERRHIAQVIAKYPTMEEAARALGIDVVTLWRRRKKYRLD